MLRIYDYAPSGNCYEVRLLLSLLGREYERVPVDIFAGDTLTDEFERLNPARETPVLALDGGHVLLQSNAILWYLGIGTDYLPTDPLAQAMVVQWLLIEQSRVVSTIGAARFFALTGRSPEQVEGRIRDGRRALDLLDGALRRGGFLVAERPSIADVSVYAYTRKAPDFGIELAEWPSVASWIRRMESLPGFIEDYVPYPENARPGVSRSIYDEAA